MLGAYKEDSERLGIKDLGNGWGNTHPYCGGTSFRYGVKPNGTIVDWCPGCGRVNNTIRVDWCPNCKSKINDHQDPHLKSSKSLVCPSAMLKAKMVLHHDDPPCAARLNNGYCTECKFVPDMQSTCLYFYCPSCDCHLKNLKCPRCGQTFEKPQP